MPKYSEKSKGRLGTCVYSIQDVFNIVIKYYDNYIIEGRRSSIKQEELFYAGKSKLRGNDPRAKHCKDASEAIDASPYPLPENWGDFNINTILDLKTKKEQVAEMNRQFKERAKFYHFAGFVQGVSCSQGMPLRWGGDWDNDKQFLDQKFDDLVHFEVYDSG